MSILDYNTTLMQAPELARSYIEQVSSLHPVDLFVRCASDRGDAEAWSEFLRRYSAKIKYFIRGTLRQDSGACDDSSASDLFQSTILRLVDNDCAAMKRFSGTTESELLAYLAVIARSVVRDDLRRLKASKRQTEFAELTEDQTEKHAQLPGALAEHPGFERVLFREVLSLKEQAIFHQSPQTSSRDRMVFDLHFSHDLSAKQIAECKGINMSKAGVEKLLNRLIDRMRALASGEKPEATLL